MHIIWTAEFIPNYEIKNIHLKMNIFDAFHLRMIDQIGDVCCVFIDTEGWWSGVDLMHSRGFKRQWHTSECSRDKDTRLTEPRTLEHLTKNNIPTLPMSIFISMSII